MRAATALDLQTRILIVDDDPGIRELMAAFLSGHGFLVDSAEDGARCGASWPDMPPPQRSGWRSSQAPALARRDRASRCPGANLSA
ncbi:hypothetical protein [Sphingomonas sp. MS122]|uniref:hypothetical protein n=1 Tax=Sphingomonas sp. MS122 TaxID=3412683 RepID=UPI003C2C3018